MSHQIIFSNEAPKPIGPYSQAVYANGFLFLSGQIPLDPQTGQMVTGSIEDQTRRVFENIKAVLSAAQMDFSCVVKATIFLKDLAHFDRINRVYEENFGTSKPARSTIQVARLPKDAEVEIEVIACHPNYPIGTRTKPALV